MSSWFSSLTLNVSRWRKKECVEGSAWCRFRSRKNFVRTREERESLEQQLVLLQVNCHALRCMRLVEYEGEYLSLSLVLQESLLCSLSNRPFLQLCSRKRRERTRRRNLWVTPSNSSKLKLNSSWTVELLPHSQTSIPVTNINNNNSIRRESELERERSSQSLPSRQQEQEEEETHTCSSPRVSWFCPRESLYVIPAKEDE